MKITLNKSSDKSFSITKVLGPFDLDKILEYYSSKFAASLDSTSLRELVDLSEVDMADASSSDIHSIADAYLKLCDQLSLDDVRVAIVSPADLNFGLARVFSAFADDPRLKIMVFRDRSLGEEFLTS